MVKHNLNPDFKTVIRIAYDFSKVQRLKFHIVDANESLIGKMTDLAIKMEKKDNWMGSVNTFLSTIIGATN